ncbi:MAG TPA: nitrate/nitrite transporter NrtS [Acidimicrobiales bacterium]|nr:nitrate/nitrite transporter NrtS [Acidimicrobiales bacterium]
MGSANDTERRPVPMWNSPFEGLVLILRGYTLRTAAAVSAVVGTFLSGVNQGSVLISGHVNAAAWIRIATNYVVPFFVSSIGYLAPSRRRRAKR